MLEEFTFDLKSKWSPQSNVSKQSGGNRAVDMHVVSTAAKSSRIIYEYEGEVSKRSVALRYSR